MPYDDPRNGGHRSPRHHFPAPWPYFEPEASRWARRALITAAVAAVVGVIAAAALLYPTDGQPAAPIVDHAFLPSFPEPSPPVSVLPAPTSSYASSYAGPPASGSPVAARRPVLRSPVTHSIRPAPVVDLDPGATVGLEVRGMPGVRMRHRNFLGRVDIISSSSSAVDRADSTFRVRPGLGDAGCVSLESVNYQGYFLRHRDFVIDLDERDGSPLFDQDATFCPRPIRDGSAVTLQSINYPDRAVSLHSDATLHLDPAGATAFVPQPPL
jgi:alpha-L-arabinofuranosidase B-like protein